MWTGTVRSAARRAGFGFPLWSKRGLLYGRVSPQAGEDVGAGGANPAGWVLAETWRWVITNGGIV